MYTQTSWYHLQLHITLGSMKIINNLYNYIESSIYYLSLFYTYVRLDEIILNFNVKDIHMQNCKIFIYKIMRYSYKMLKIYSSRWSDLTTKCEGVALGIFCYRSKVHTLPSTHGYPKPLFFLNQSSGVL